MDVAMALNGYRVSRLNMPHQIFQLLLARMIGRSGIIPTGMQKGFYQLIIDVYFMRYIHGAKV